MLLRSLIRVLRSLAVVFTSRMVKKKTACKHSGVVSSSQSCYVNCRITDRRHLRNRFDIAVLISRVCHSTAKTKLLSRRLVTSYQYTVGRYFTDRKNSLTL